MAITTVLGEQAKVEYQNMNYDGSGVLLPLFVAIAKQNTSGGVEKWYCFSCTGTKYTGESYYTRWRGFWNNDTGGVVIVPFILLCGNTSRGTIPSADWLEQYLNGKATGQGINLDILKTIDYVVVATGLTENDKITLQDDEPLRVTVDLIYG